MNRLAWILLVAMAGCAPKIPTKVAAEEYEVYSAWIRHHFAKEQPRTLYLATRTFSWETASTCDTKAMRKAGVDDSLARRLRELGEAEYPLNLYSRTMKIPWDFKEASGFPDRFSEDQPGTFRIVAFSRVAFNTRRTRALFAVSNICGGLCGGGGVLSGVRKDSAWTFQQTGCMWVY